MSSYCIIDLCNYRYLNTQTFLHFILHHNSFISVTGINNAAIAIVRIRFFKYFYYLINSFSSGSDFFERNYLTFGFCIYIKNRFNIKDRSDCSAKRTEPASANKIFKIIHNEHCIKTASES